MGVAINILTQDSRWSLCKTAFRYTGNFLAIHLAAKAGSIEPLLFGNSVRPYINGLLGMMALGQLTLGVGSLLRNVVPIKKIHTVSNRRETAQKVLQIAQGSLLLTHLYSASTYTSLLIGGHLLATGIVRIAEGGSLLHEELRGRILDAVKKTDAHKINRKNLAQAIVLCGLGIWGVYSSLGPLTERLHQWQPLTNRMQVLKNRDWRESRFIRDSRQEISSKVFYYHNWNDFIYDPIVQKEFEAYCTDEVIAADEAITADSCYQESHDYLDDKYMERRIKPSILLELQSRGISFLEFSRGIRKLCESQEMNDLCSGFKNLDGNPLYEKILDTMKEINSLDKMWYKRLEKPDSALLIGKIFKDTKKRFNAAVILNGDDAPDALKSIGGKEILIQEANVYVEKISNEQGICDILKNALTWSGRPLDLISIVGHGSQFGIRLSNKTMLDTVNVADAGDCFKKALTPEAPIALHSCSTGKQRPRYLNIAERLAGETGHPIDAPMQASRSIDCSYSFPQPQADSQTGNSPRDIRFHCVKTKKFEDDDGDNMFRTYTRRFIRELNERDTETIRFDSQI